jgi:tetratricopeptide (TPR) repeat protein
VNETSSQPRPHWNLAFLSRSRPARRRLAALLLALLAAGGCKPAGDPNTAKTTTVNAPASSLADVQAIDELTIGIEAIRHMANANGENSATRAEFYLNQWIRGLDLADAEWSADPLIGNLPSSLRETPGLTTLSRLTFDSEDLKYFQQNLWLRDVARRVARKQPPAGLTAWLKELERSANITTAEKLAQAERLFDWTVRNIQLDPLLPPPKPPVATANPDAKQQLFDSLPAAQRGEPGPGYQATPLLTLLRGRGDAWQRARIFILLCRQMGIEAVTLGIVNEQSSAGAQPWAAAVLLDGQLYLFETALGLPIPGPGLQGIATLEQAVAQPGLLAQLNLSDGVEYAVQQEQLGQVVALIEAEPTALSRRMKLVDGSLRGKRFLALSVAPTQLAKRLRACKHISTVSLWRVPFEAVLYYYYGQPRRLQHDPALQVEFQREMAIFQPTHPLMQARNLHFQGVFSTVDQTPGARTLYMRSRVPDRNLELLQTSNALREQAGVASKLPKDVQQRNALLDAATATARQAKYNATYWLALTYFEAGKYEAAREWIEQRALPAKPPTPWAHGALYNLGRAYEASGDVEKACELYRSDPDSPQSHGNLLRAKWLEKASS